MLDSGVLLQKYINMYEDICVENIWKGNAVITFRVEKTPS